MPCDVQFVLTPGGPVPGECLPLNGTKGEISIRLREPIIPTAITYEHVPSAITFDFRSAPNDVTVVGRPTLLPWLRIPELEPTSCVSLPDLFPAKQPNLVPGDLM